MAGIKGTRTGGRNAKSIHEHQLAGTFRRDRHGDAGSISVPEGVPTPPVELSGEALAEWGRMVDRLRQTRTLSTVDDAVLYQYSRLYAETEALAADQARTAELIDRLDSEIDAQPQNERGSLISDLIKLKQIEARYRTRYARAAWRSGSSWSS